MEAPRFDFDDVFDDDYLFFYLPILHDERTEQEVAVIERLLELRAGARILDLPCGHGRIANRLARDGYAVTGVDRSKRFLEVARGDAASMGVTVDYVEGDMRAPSWEREFDAVVNWFTSFGYFDDEDNRAVLRAARGALRDGGVLLMELNNRDWVLRNFQRATVAERDDAFMIDRGTLDSLHGRIQTERVVVRRGAVRRMHFTVRMFTAAELAQWLRDAGFAEIEVFDRAGEPFEPLSSNRMIVRARVPVG